MRRYSTVAEQNATADDTVVTLTSATTIKPSIYNVEFGSAATPADQAFNMQIGRTTAEGTNTTVTPQALDPDDPASLADGGSNHTSEPTYTSNATLLSFSVNQQATYRWVSPPDEGLILPATANNGAGLRFVVVSGGTALCETTLLHAE